MSREVVYVSAKTQLELMYNIAGDTCPDSYDDVRERLFMALEDEYGKKVDIETEAIDEKSLAEFLEWMHSEE